jgi:hypothetical protein
MIVILLSIVGIFMIYRVSNMIKKRRAVS